ncbi:hypothetical protein [Mycolicibacterium elephantis]
MPRKLRYWPSAAGIAFRARMGGGVADDADRVDEAVGPLIAEGLKTLST